MKNMKVSIKLIASFSIMIFMAMVVGVFGIIGMYRMNKGDDQLYHNNYLPSIIAGDMSQCIVEQRVYFRNFILYDATDDAFTKAYSDLEASHKTVDEDLKRYKETITNPDDQAAYDEFIKVYNDEWKPFLNNVHKLGAEGRTEEAKAQLKIGAPLVSRLNDLSSKLQQINEEDGKATVDANTSLFHTMIIVAIIILLIADAIAIVLAIYISGLIVKPLAALTAFMKKAGSTGDITLSQTDLEIISKYAKVRDEIGQCIGSTSSFLSHMHDVEKALRTIADGDLTIELALLSDTDTMGKSLIAMEENLNQMFIDINAASSQVAIGADQVAYSAQDLANGSTEQASCIEELSSSMSEIAAKTKSNANMASKAAELADVIKDHAEKGSLQMNEMMSAVREISEASGSISKVIKAIEEIASQTNLLSLNAAIEAARAGEAGKGFAVVADEIGKLATQSAEAARDTGILIENSIAKANLGVHIADETAASLTEIVTGVNESSQLVGEINRASEDQSQGIQQIDIAIEQVAQVVQQNSATAEESAAASEEMSGQASLMQDLIKRFKIRDNGISSPMSLK